MTIKELCKICHKVAVSKGWWDENRNRGEIIALIHSELSEALEALRSGNRQKKNSKWEKDTYEDELIDVIIRVIDLAEAEGVNVEWQLKNKIEYNKKRPKKHGKRF